MTDTTITTDAPVFSTTHPYHGFDPATGEFTAQGAAEIAAALRILAAASWTMAEQKGFHETERGFPEEIALMHSELSEALESHRNDEPFLWYKDKGDPDYQYETPRADDTEPIRKAEGIASELVDVIIRIGDSVGGDLNKIEKLVEAIIMKNAYNASRPYKHGKVC